MLESVNLFTKNLKKKKKICFFVFFLGVGWGGGTRVSEFSVQRIQLNQKKNIYFFFFFLCIFFSGWGGGGGGGGGRGELKKVIFFKKKTIQVKTNFFWRGVGWGGGGG